MADWVENRASLKNLRPHQINQQPREGNSSIKQSIVVVWKIITGKQQQRLMKSKKLNANRYRNSPVCVLMCRLSRLGLSNAFPQTSHGRRFRSLRAGRDFGVDFGTIAESIKSPVLLAPDDDCSDSPDIDLCSSSDGGEMGKSTRDSSDNDRSNGESIIMQQKRRSNKHENQG